MQKKASPKSCYCVMHGVCGRLFFCNLQFCGIYTALKTDSIILLPALLP